MKIWQIYNMKYYSAIKKNEILSLQENGERGEGQREEEGRADVINAYMTV
jgi:hypothetical protein